MDDLWKTITARLKALQEHWAVWAVIGSGALYLLGYLVTRFQLTLFGVATSLDVVEERYFFAGARFAVYLLTSLPNLLFFVLPLALVVWLISLPFRRVTALNTGWKRFFQWWRHPIRLRLTGVIFSVAIIQFVMRHCFVLNNLLLAPALPGPSWLHALLLEETETATYFAVLTGASLITICLFVATRHWPAQEPLARGLEFLLGALLTIQLLLLPINYSYLVAHKSLPRVTSLSKDLIASGRSAWLVWENDNAITFLVGNATNLLHDRLLVTLQSEEVKTLRITQYDEVFRLLFRKSSPISNEANLSSVP